MKSKSVKSGPRYYSVTRGFTLWKWLDETYSSNHWYGSSQIFHRKNEEMKTKRGDQLHCLPGGNFLVRMDGTVLPVCLTKPYSEDKTQHTKGCVIKIVDLKKVRKVLAYR
jgi:hypothetical protein